ncbi:hypothetical protein SESBI_33631 [Sesbania bispinosa]|nr:hypothetical protein SESBI_33631 [Sesbania bispinosa]
MEQNSVSVVRGSPPNGSSGRPTALPAAAWGTRATNCHPAAGGLLGPNGLTKPKPDTISSTRPFSSDVAGTIQASSHSDATKRPLSSDGSLSMTPEVNSNSMDILVGAGEKTLASNVSLEPVNLNSQLSSLPLARDSDRESCTTSNTTNSVDVTTNSISSFGPEEAVTSTNEEIQNLSYELSSVNIETMAKMNATT